MLTSTVVLELLLLLLLLITRLLMSVHVGYYYVSYSLFTL